MTGFPQLNGTDSNDANLYFADLTNPNPVRYRRSVMEEGTRPEYIIPIPSSNGVWGMVKHMSGDLTQKGGWHLSKVIRRFCPVSYPVMTSFCARAAHILCERYPLIDPPAGGLEHPSINA